jgi:3-oxoacyl-[acyl-carrier protein] reductase
MDMGLDGKAAFVGGASKGIGKAVALGLAREGCRVAICARTREPLETAAADIRTETGREALPVVCDMANAGDISRAVAQAADAFGGLDVVVNNAGGPPTGTFDTLDERYWQHALDQNLLSAVRTIREALPHLRRSGAGRIINITSVAVKQPIDGLMLSNATRVGVVAMAKTLSRELGPEGITVNNVCPGNIATERLISLIEERAKRQGVGLEDAVQVEEGRVPMGYLGDPEDVANLVVFLASAKARYITGTTTQVDGGSTTALLEASQQRPHTHLAPAGLQGAYFARGTRASPRAGR